MAILAQHRPFVRELVLDTEARDRSEETHLSTTYLLHVFVQLIGGYTKEKESVGENLRRSNLHASPSTLDPPLRCVVFYF